MQLVIVRKNGRVVMEAVEHEPGEPKSAEVLVRNLYCGASLTEVFAEKDQYRPAKKPFVPGYDFLGQVVKVGNAVYGLQVGQTVCCLNPKLGAYAEFVMVPLRYLVIIRRPDKLLEISAAIINYLTASSMLLKQAKLTRGQTCLVYGAAGGIGTAVLDIARSKGIHVIGTCSESKWHIVEDFGGEYLPGRDSGLVEEVLKRHPHGVDAVLDAYGAASFKRSAQMLTKNGTLVPYGFFDGCKDPVQSFLLGMLALVAIKLQKPVRIKGSSIPREVANEPEWYQATLAEIIDKVQSGEYKPIISRVFKLSEASEAHRYIERRESIGKVVLDCTSNS